MILTLPPFQLTPSIFNNKFNIYQRRMPSAWSAQPNSQHFNGNFWPAMNNWTTCLFQKCFSWWNLESFPINSSLFRTLNPLCASFLIDKAYRKRWRTKGYGWHGIRRDDDDNTGAGTSTYQLVPAQAGLVPQSSLILTGSRIWGVNVMVDHFSNLMY